MLGCTTRFFEEVLGCDPRPEREAHEAAGVHRASRRCSGRVAARGACAAAGEAADHRFLGPEHAFGRYRWTAAFVQRLRELGWIEGRTIAIEYRWGRDARNASPRSRPNSSGSRSMSSSRREPRGRCGEAGDIGHPDRVRGGGRPGRRRPGRQSGATGRQRHRPVESAPDLAGKRLELLREVVPGLRRLAIMGNVGNPIAVLEMGEVRGGGPHARPRSRHARNPARRGYRARLRGAQGPRGCTLCLFATPLLLHQPDSHQHLGARRATADDATTLGSTSKWAV